MKRSCAGLLLMAACQSPTREADRNRSDAVASASRSMSGPSFLSEDVLAAGLSALRAQSSARALRLEVRPSELVLQLEEPGSAGGVVEYRYRDGKVSGPERAVIRGKGQLDANLFALSDVNLRAIPELTRAAVARVDADGGSVESVLVRRNLPESEDVQMRVYVTSPRKSGQLDADADGKPL